MDKCNCQIPNTDLAGRCFKCGGFIEIPTSKKELTTEERIKADAEKHVEQIRNVRVRYPTYNGYIAGATAVHERAQVLVDALEWLRQFGNEPSIKFIDNVLQQWKGKEVENGA